MDFFYIASIFLVFSLGFIIGVSFKGIEINHYNAKDEVPEEYNESLASDLPPEIQQYYQENQGFNKF